MIPQKIFKIRIFNLAENEFQKQNSLTFGNLSQIPWLFRQIPWLSEVSFKFPDFSRFSRSVATLTVCCLKKPDGVAGLQYADRASASRGRWHQSIFQISTKCFQGSWEPFFISLHALHEYVSEKGFLLHLTQMLLNSKPIFILLKPRNVLS